MNRIYILIAAVLAGAGGLWWVNSLINERDALIEVKASLQRSIAAKDLQIEQASTARAVADAVNTRLKQRADEYAALREALLKGGQDAPIPYWFCDYLNELLPGTCNRDTPAIP